MSDKPEDRTCRDLRLSRVPRFCLALSCVAFAALVARSQSSTAADAPVAVPSDERLAAAAEIHRRVLTLDSHVDIAGAHYATERLDPGVDHPRLKCDLVKMARGGVDAVFLVVYTGQAKRDAAGYRRALDSALARFEAVRRLPAMYPDRCRLATSPGQVRAIVADGKRAIAIGVENAYPVGTDLANLRRFYELGARYVTLSHNGHNQVCDSAIPRPQFGDGESEHGGLSAFGRQVVVEMNRLGMMIDVSHVAPRSFWDVIDLSKAPIIASHSGCRALDDHPRNLDDDQLAALARNGGVIQIVALGAFLRGPEPDGKRVDATVGDYVDHVDHAVKVAGIDHVGIGSDFDGGGGITGFNDHSEAPNVTVELLRRGYSEPEIEKIWGGNLLRVWEHVEEVAEGATRHGVLATPRVDATAG